MQQTSNMPRTPEEWFGHAVTSFRTARKMSQRDFAAKLTERGMPVDASAVSRIEKGSRSVRLVEAMTIAEVLEADLDFLTSGSKTPSQEFQSMRRRTDNALRNLIEPVVGTAFSLWEAQNHLKMHPELLETLEDEDEGRPSVPEEYLAWVAARLAKWEVAEEDYVVTESDEEADRITEVIARFVRIHLGPAKDLPEKEGGDNGEYQEEA